MVDIGNTRVKWRLLDAAMVSVDSGCVINSSVNPAYVSSQFSHMSVSHIYVSNVSNDSMLSVFQELAFRLDAQLHTFSSQSVMHGVKFNYKEISRMGVDRSLALVGAFSGNGVLVIDAGSAITADYLDDKGEHLGGYIIPGIEMSRNLLLSKTAKVGVMAEIGSDQPGLSTNDCVNNGVAIMLRSLVLGLINVAEQKGIDQFIITGGDAGLFERWGDSRLKLYDNLVLDGMVKCCLNESKRKEGL